MTPGVYTVATCFKSNESNINIVDKGMEDSNCIRSPANAGKYGIRKLSSEL